MTDEMYALYKQEDIQGLYDLTEKYMVDEMAAIESKLLEDRNRKWIPRLRSMMSDGKIFIAVGAAHLGGEAGVISLLKEEGFNVFPILPSP